jgi:hypothetical protein
MEKRQRIILYGDSIILSGMRASLNAYPGLEVIVLDQPLAKPSEEIHAFNPTAVIFDLGSVQPDFPSSLLQQPNLLLVGIAPDTNQALVWSGQQTTATATADLIKIIQKGSGS